MLIVIDWKRRDIRIVLVNLIDQIRGEGSEVDRQAWNPDFEKIHRQFVECTGLEPTKQELFWNLCSIRKHLSRVRKSLGLN